MGFSSYENLARNGAGTQRNAGQSLSFESAQGFNISVEGDLSEAELEDIQSLLTKVDGVMGKMLEGDMDGAIAGALQMEGGDTIAGFEANLKLERTVMAERQLMGRVGGEKAAEEGGGSGALAGGNYLKDLMNEMMASVEQAETAPEKLEQPMDNYFSALLKNLEQEKPEEDPAVKLTEMFRTQMLDQLKGMMKTDGEQVA